MGVGERSVCRLLVRFLRCFLLLLLFVCWRSHDCPHMNAAGKLKRGDHLRPHRPLQDAEGPIFSVACRCD
uniref:Putative secreted protein n=1 Tax=Ixodes ricinus TaxID=34613 RepID=A0A6B0U1C6_IXORI